MSKAHFSEPDYLMRDVNAMTASWETHIFEFARTAKLNKRPEFTPCTWPL